MKKMILGLALCLGLSQVVVAQKEELTLTENETNSAMTWIKNNPKKFAAIVTSVVAAAGLVYAGKSIYDAEADKDAKWARTTRVKNGLYNGFVNPFVTKGAFLKDKAVAGKDATFKFVKEHKLAVGIPTGVVVIALAAVAAHYTELDKAAQEKLTQLWNKICKKATTEEVILI